MRIEGNRQAMAYYGGRLLFGGALCFFGYRTFDAIVRQRSFSATLLPAAGLTATVVVPLLLLRRSAPTPQQLFDLLQAKQDFPPHLSQETAQALAELGAQPDGDGSYPILGWRREDVAQLLILKIQLPQEVQNQLFLKYLKDSPWSLESFLRGYPNAIEALRDSKEHLLLNQSISRATLQIIVNAMKAKGIAFSQEEVWIARAVDGTTEVNPREWIALSYETRQKILPCIARGAFANQLWSINSKFAVLVSDLNSQRQSYWGLEREDFHQMRAREEAWVRSCLAPIIQGTSYLAAQWSWEALQALNEYIEIPLPIQQAVLSRFLDRGEETDLKALLTIWPSAIRGIEERRPGLLMAQALELSRTKEFIQQLVTAMRDQGEEPNRWVARAAEDQADFPDEEFGTLGAQEKSKIYWIANKLKARNLVARLNGLGMRRQFNNPLPLIPILDPEMDLIAAEQAVTSCLQSLRQRGLLLKGSEFVPEGYVRKSHCLERILGADRIRAVAEQYGCRSIFTPKKVAVIDDGCSELNVSVKLDNGFPSKYMGCPLEDQSKGDYPLAIYAERIRPDHSRKMEIDSVLELATVLWHSGFTDFKDGNIFKTEKGFYFIDTEFISFSFRWSREVRKANILEYVLPLLKEEDRSTLTERLETVFAAPSNQSIKEHQEGIWDSKPLLNSFRSVTIPMAAIFSSASSSS